MSREAVLDAPSGVRDDARCEHCHQSLSAGQVIEAPVQGRARRFCCHGCRSVCEAIYAAGLEGFYARLQTGDALAPPPELPAELALYDLPEVQDEFVSAGEDSREVNLLVEGIHCAACVWLIESSLRRVPGVLEARVNLTGRKLRVRWDDSRLQLSTLLQRLGSLGYAAVPFDPQTAEDSLRRQNRHLLYRMGFAGFTMMNLLWISIALYSGADQGEYRSLFHWIGLLLATPTLLYSGYPFYKGAWQGLRQWRFGMDLPIAIGASITYLYSVYVTLSGTSVGDVYFDTVVNFLFVILVGRYLEAMSKRQALASTQRLLDLQPRVATVLRDGEEQLVPIRSVAEGEYVRVRPGERIPVDGEVASGSSRVDEAMLTGESEPVLRAPGSQVCAGTINGEGSLDIRVTGLLQETALGRIIQLVEEAQASRAPIQQVADRIVPWFVLITLSLAAVTFGFWLQTGFEQALMAATAVLIITCPCAFGLATPMAIAVASGLGARNGILVKNGAVLETLSSVRDFVFDKTGTLTEGRIQLVSLHGVEVDWRSGQALAGSLAQSLGLAAALERRSEHPLARALVEGAESLNAPGSALACEDFRNRPGQGVVGRVGGHQVAVGTAVWMRALGVSPAPALAAPARALEQAGRGAVWIAVDGCEVAVAGVEDRLRDDAPALVKALRAQGASLTLLSGDRQPAAEAVASALGGMQVIAEVLPEDKDRVIAELQAAGRPVVMVGDGVNDAPALVRADVGIALGSGTDVSIASADIVLLSSDLDNVALATALSKRTLRTIRQNIGISILYNLIMVPLAMAAMVTPLVAAITMPISSLLVIGNAARIRTLFRERDRGRTPKVQGQAAKSWL
ncbi:heavy metal translocating P-type ATPase [Motiliproteus sp. SC1-56]|uniref:heavy metal translocating P-type ATPase n=1 Tax=Motiliproteus sp. SC1-56 TaxID=2799565 RepID=UPI001A8E715D|nr:heavy metal translocating P-type ATPase [Motiliproteus sp. SC1-56]